MLCTIKLHQADLAVGKPIRLMDNMIFDGLKLFLLGQWEHGFCRILVACGNFISHFLPQPIGICNRRLLCQLISNVIHQQLNPWRQIPIYSFALGAFKIFRKLQKKRFHFGAVNISCGYFCKKFFYCLFTFCL